MFYDDFLCSFTNTFYSTPTTGAGNNNNADEAKYVSDIECLYVLGRPYKQPINESDLIKDILARLWFTYRRGFSHIGGYGGPDTDQGWGCMIRCGQMLLAECFIRIYLGRDFKWEPNMKDNEMYWRILEYFRDDKQAPYSIQQITSMGASTENIPIGKWFGPNAIVQVLNKLSSFDDSNHLRFYIAMDNCVFIDDIYESMKQCNKTFKCKKPHKSKDEWDPLLLILPLRLGLNEFNEEYKESIKRCFELEHIVGMIGGKPNSAYYFYGYADESLLYLDPHEVQNYEADRIKDESYHTQSFWKLKFSNLDPSVALAFLCKTENDFRSLIGNFREKVLKTSSPMNLLFEIFDKKPCYNVKDIDSEDLSNKSEDEYVLL